jgi:hemerythrin
MDEESRALYDIFGDDTVDQQHRQLFAKYGAIMQASDAEITRDELLEMLNDIDSFARTHFATEEKILEDYSYPDLATHIDEHRQFSNTLTETRGKLAGEGTMSTILTATTRNLIRWLSKHVATTDVAAGDFIRQKRSV